jgi:hypothetical protein
MAAEAGQQISHAVLRAVLEQGQGWQHGHWLLTLRFTPNHASRHAHGRLVALNSQATPLQALAQHIAAPDGLPSSNAELLRLAEACHQLLARRMNKQAWRVEAAGRRSRSETRRRAGPGSAQPRNARGGGVDMLRPARQCRA